MKKLTVLTMISILMLMIAACSNSSANSSDSTETADKKNEGKLAPSFHVKDVKGQTYQLSDYKGKKVYVKFWASWCPICLAGLEELNTLAGENHDFEVLSIVSPGYNNEKKSESFIGWFNGVENTSNITVLLDEEGSITKQYNVRGYPTSAFIGSDGVLVKTQPGHVPNDQIIKEFESIK